jgi:hypothetical protein
VNGCERVKKPDIGCIRAARVSLAPLAAACGERVGVRGRLTVVQETPAEVGRLPLTRDPRASAPIPTSPRKRGEVTGRAANSLAASCAAVTNKPRVLSC